MKKVRFIFDNKQCKLIAFNSLFFCFNLWLFSVSIDCNFNPCVTSKDQKWGCFSSPCKTRSLVFFLTSSLDRECLIRIQFTKIYHPFLEINFCQHFAIDVNIVCQVTPLSGWLSHSWTASTKTKWRWKETKKIISFGIIKEVVKFMIKISKDYIISQRINQYCLLVIYYFTNLIFI